MRLAPWILTALLAGAPMARAAEQVDVALALVTDVSRSIDDAEFDLEKQGYATAFTSPQVVAAIHGGPVGAIAVTYIEFASNYEVKTVLDWTVLRDDASLSAFAERLTQAPRSYYGRTAISAGIDHAVQALAESGFEAARRVIDVCGDGTNNAGREITAARDDALNDRHHDQRARDHQRPSDGLDLRACAAARGPRQLLPGERHRRRRAAS